MPNHITNILKVKGKKEDIEKFEKEVESDNSIFDFNKIIPMPKELEHTSSPVKIITEEEYKKQETEKLYLKDGIIGRGLTENISTQYKKLFGFDNWYDWAIENWSTKWNAYSVYKDKYYDEIGKDRSFKIVFDTAWSTPVPIFIELSKMFKDLKFEIKYADEDIGNNCGIIRINNGELTHITKYGNRYFSRTVRNFSKRERVDSIVTTKDD